MKLKELAYAFAMTVGVVALFAIFAGPPAYIAYTMDLPYYIYEIMQGCWATLVLGITYLIIYFKIGR